MWLIIPFLLVLHVGVCLLMVLSVLMQLPRSEGLGAAFGGGVTENIFGAQTTNVLAKFTTGLGIAFFIITLALAVAYSHQDAAKRKDQRTLMNAPLAGEAAAPSPAASPVAEPSPAIPQAAVSPAEPTSAPATPTQAVPAQATPAPATSAQSAPASATPAETAVPVAPSPAPSPVTP